MAFEREMISEEEMLRLQREQQLQQQIQAAPAPQTSLAAPAVPQPLGQFSPAIQAPVSSPQMPAPPAAPATPAQLGAPSAPAQGDWQSYMQTTTAPEEAAAPDPGTYRSDIDYLRGGPSTGMASAYEQQLQRLQGPSQTRPDYENLLAQLRGGVPYQGRYEQDMGYLSQLPEEFKKSFGSYMDFLRSAPGQSEYEQGVMTQAAQNADRRAAAMRQNAVMDAARRGIAPTSGVTEDAIRSANEAAFREKMDAERGLAQWKMEQYGARRREEISAQEKIDALQRSRFGEARGLATELDRARLARLTAAPEAAGTMEGADIGRGAVGLQLFREMAAEEQARRGQARGIEAGLDADERQRLMDALGFIQGAQPSSTPAALAGQQSALAGQLAGQAGAGFGEALGGFGQSALLTWLMSRNPQLYQSLFQ